MDKTSGNPFLSVPFRVLSDDQARAIHEASLRVLQQTGYHTPVLEARQLLQEAGARLEGERAYIPPDLVENALQSLRPVRLYDRQGEPTRLLQPGHVAFSTIADTFYIQDPYPRSVRPFLKADQGWLATVIDALPGIEYVQCVGQAQDVPDNLQSQVAVSQTVRRTSKPILVYPYDRAGLLDILDMLYVIAGGEAAFREKPFLMCAAVPAAPLSGTIYSLELLLTCAERGVPVLSYCLPCHRRQQPGEHHRDADIDQRRLAGKPDDPPVKKPRCALCHSRVYRPAHGYEEHPVVILRPGDADGVFCCDRPGSLVRHACLRAGDDLRHPADQCPDGGRDVCPMPKGVSQPG